MSRPSTTDAGLLVAATRRPVANEAALDRCIVARPTSLLADDITDNAARIRDAVQGRRLLVVGGGGSIGSATTRLLVDLAPACLHVIDQSENYLAELVRDIRSRSPASDKLDMMLWPIDYGSPVSRRLLADQRPYDIVLNFAALKHVRSEKDVHALLQMIDTNVVRQARFKQWIAERGGTTRYFGVSTDKAANPVSLMGATKRLMEDVLFHVATSSETTVTSARFANVAFSNGSLLQSWLRRLELGQPLAVPRATRRYFVTQREAGEICLLAALLGGDNDIVVPRLDPRTELQLLEDLAVNVLALNGLQAEMMTDEAEARDAVVTLEAKGRWPLILTPQDTSGEKPYEEFVGVGERTREIGLSALLAVVHESLTPPSLELIARFERLITEVSEPASKADIVGAISEVIPAFHHIETGKSLDHRM